MTGESPSKTVEARLLPIPATVSGPLQSLLGCVSPPLRKIPRTAEEWHELLQPQLDLRQSLDDLCERFGVTVTPEVRGGVPCHTISPSRDIFCHPDRILLGFPGGGFVFSAGQRGLTESIVMAGLSGYRVISVDYRLLPRHPFPAAIDDAIAVWRAAVSMFQPHHVGLFGSSVGGALVLALVQRARRECLPLPGAIMCGSPWSDLSKTGDSYFANEGVDNTLTYDGFWAAVARLYAGERELTDPLLSPVYGDFDGFPPTFLVSGTRDLFLSNTVRVHRKLTRAGAESRLEIEEGQFHMAYLYAATLDAPEGMELYSEVAKFFDRHLGRVTTTVPRPRY